MDSSCRCLFDLFAGQSRTLCNAESSASRTWIAILLFAVSDDGFSREKVERAKGLSLEVTRNVVIEISGAHEVFDQAVLQAVVGNDRQSAPFLKQLTEESNIA